MRFFASIFFSQIRDAAVQLLDIDVVQLRPQIHPDGRDIFSAEPGLLLLLRRGQPALFFLLVASSLIRLISIRPTPLSNLPGNRSERTHPFCPPGTESRRGAPPQDLVDDVKIASIGDDHVRSRAGGHMGRAELRGHAAGARRCCRCCPFPMSMNRSVQMLHLADKVAPRGFLWGSSV